METIAGSMSTTNYLSQEFQSNNNNNNNSFTALLELPPTQAMQLLHSSSDSHSHALFSHREFTSRAADDSPEPSHSLTVKVEPLDSGSNPNSFDLKAGSDCDKPLKRKDKEKKGKTSNKKSKMAANQSTEDGEKLPYVHVRARRGQATDSHSLAERARREKINARMKLLQELVPGCNKISGTALVLDEIINHVQSLQRQVEYLSMRLASVNPRIDFNLDSLISAGTESMLDCNLQGTAMPVMWPEIQVNGDRQQFQQWHFGSLNQPVWVKDVNDRNLLTPENSLLSYDSSANSALTSSQLKMEL